MKHCNELKAAHIGLDHWKKIPNRKERLGILGKPGTKWLPAGFAMELFAVLGISNPLFPMAFWNPEFCPQRNLGKSCKTRWSLSGPISGHEITQERPLFYLFRPWTLFCSQNCFQWTFPKPREGQFLFCRYGWHFLGLFLVSEKTSFHHHKIVWLLCVLFRVCYVTPKRPLSKRQKK